MDNYAFSRMDLKEDEKIAVEEKKAKLYVPSLIKTQKNLVPFLFLGSAENFCNFAKLSYFWICVFFIVSEGQTNSKLELT